MPMDAAIVPPDAPLAKGVVVFYHAGNGAPGDDTIAFYFQVVNNGTKVERDGVIARSDIAGVRKRPPRPWPAAHRRGRYPRIPSACCRLQRTSAPSPVGLSGVPEARRHCRLHRSRCFRLPLANPPDWVSVMPLEPRRGAM